MCVPEIFLYFLNPHMQTRRISVYINFRNDCRTGMLARRKLYRTYEIAPLKAGPRLGCHWAWLSESLFQKMGIASAHHHVRAGCGPAWVLSFAAMVVASSAVELGGSPENGLLPSLFLHASGV